MYVKLNSELDSCDTCDMSPILRAINKLYPSDPGAYLETFDSPQTCSGIFKTVINEDDKSETTDITPVINELATIYNEMTTVTSKLHEIVSDPKYSFFEEDFYIVAKRWRELSDERQQLVEKLVGDKEIKDMSEYIKQLCLLSKLNSQRNHLVDELTTLVSIPFKFKEDEYMSCISELKDEIKILKQENARLTSIISESSIQATNYSRIKDEEIAHLHAKYEKLENKYNELLMKNNKTENNVERDSVVELKNRLDDLIKLVSSSSV